MPYVAARHLTYNGKVYERGEVVDVTDETFGRIESYLSTKTFTFMEKAPKKAGKPEPLLLEPEVAETVEEPVVEPVEEVVEDVVVDLNVEPVAE